MKKLILGAWIAVLGFGATAQEQERKQKTPEEMATWRVERLKAELDLNAAQEETIKMALLAQMTKAKEVREEHSGDKEAMKKAMEPIRAEFQSTMKTTLTDAQYAKWAEMHKKREEQAKHRKGAKHRMHHQEKQPNQERKQKLEEK
jgi:hypothetical protein